MKKFDYVITDSIGIHARPAGQLVKLVKDLEAAVTIEAEGKTADLKKLMAVMSLGVKNAANVTITAEGADEELAIERLEEYFKANL
jgi:phosphocarrier protein HPr